MNRSTAILTAGLALSSLPLLAQPGRPRFDLAVVERGRVQFKSSCGFCHSSDATGNRAPDLIRSALLAHVVDGDLLGPIIRDGRPDKGMPGQPLTHAQISDIAVFLHNQVARGIASASVALPARLAGRSHRTTRRGNVQGLALLRDARRAPDFAQREGRLAAVGCRGRMAWAKLPAQASRNGYFFVVDRTTGEHILTKPFVKTNWASHADAKGHSMVQAIDTQTGNIKWSKELGAGENVAGMLTTAGKLLSTQDNMGNLMALDPATGKTLWHVPVGGQLVSAPMTYELDGRQYPVVPVQNVILARALPEKK